MNQPSQNIVLSACLTLIISTALASGTTAAARPIIKKYDVRPFTSLSKTELQDIRKKKKDVILSEQSPVDPAGIIIKLVGKDGKTGQIQVFFLNTCTGTLQDSTGSVVYQYPGEWGGGDC